MKVNQPNYPFKSIVTKLKNKHNELLISLFSICLSLLLISIPLIGLFHDGPYLNFLKNYVPLSNYFLILFSFLFLFLFIKFAVTIKNRIKWLYYVLLFLPFLLIFRFYNLDIAILVNLLYFNLFFFLGELFLSNYRQTPILLMVPVKLLFGMLLTLLIYFVFSIFKIATGNILLILALSINIFSFIFQKNLFNEIKKIAKITTHKLPALGISLLLTVFFILILKANNQPSHDESWYSLRTHELLNRNGSFFETIIYPANWVAYYPKLFEILIFPLQTFSNYAFSRIFSVFIWGIVSITALSIISGNKHLRFINNRHLIVTLAITITPVIGNIAISTKGEIFSLYVFLISILFLKEFINKGEFYYWAQAFFLVLLSITARLSAIPFVVVFILFSCGLLIILINTRTVNWKILKYHYLYFLLPILVFALILYRTYLLTGVPIVQIDLFPFVKDVFNFFNWTYTNEFLQPIIRNASNHIPKLGLLHDILLDPNKIRASMEWYSNYYLILLTFAIYGILRFKKLNQYRFEFYFSITLISIFYLLVVFTFSNKFMNGGDGNYFLIPIIISSILLASIKHNNTIINQSILFISIAYLVSHLMLTLVTGSNWDPGFRHYNKNLISNPFSGCLTNDIYKQRAIYDQSIEDIIEQIPKNQKVYLAGMGNSYLNWQLGYSFLNIANCNQFNLKEFSFFNHFLKEAKINFLLAPNFPNDSEFYRYIIQLHLNPKVKTFVGKTMILIDLRKFNFDVIDKEENDQKTKKRIKVAEPKLIEETKQNIPSWIKKIDYVNSDEYYNRQMITFLAMDNACSFQFTISETSDTKINLNFSTRYNFKKFNGQGQLMLKIVNDTGDIIVKEDFVIKHELVYTPQYSLSGLKKGNYRIEFYFNKERWDTWISMAIAKPEVYVENLKSSF